MHAIPPRSGGASVWAVGYGGKSTPLLADVTSEIGDPFCNLGRIDGREIRAAESLGLFHLLAGTRQLSISLLAQSKYLFDLLDAGLTIAPLCSAKRLSIHRVDLPLRPRELNSFTVLFDRLR